MTIDWSHFAPRASLAGGALIGTAAAMPGGMLIYTAANRLVHGPRRRARHKA
jgi:hypothetical protein